MEVVFVVAVVTCEDVYVVVIFDACVRVAWRWSVAVAVVHLRPLVVHSVVLPEVVHAVVAVVPSKYEQRVLVSHHDVAVASARRVGRVDLRPLRPLEVELVEVVDTVAAIITSKNIESVVKNYPHVKRPYPRRCSARLHGHPLL